MRAILPSRFKCFRKLFQRLIYSGLCPSPSDLRRTPVDPNAEYQVKRGALNLEPAAMEAEGMSNGMHKLAIITTSKHECRQAKKGGVGQWLAECWGYLRNYLDNTFAGSVLEK